MFAPENPLSVDQDLILLLQLPYAWKLVLQFNIGDKSDASFYAGILISAFSLAECLTGMLWGGISDKVGRKPILLFGKSLQSAGFSSNDC